MACSNTISKALTKERDTLVEIDTSSMTQHDAARAIRHPPFLSFPLLLLVWRGAHGHAEFAFSSFFSNPGSVAVFTVSCDLFLPLCFLK